MNFGCMVIDTSEITKKYILTEYERLEKTEHCLEVCGYGGKYDVKKIFSKFIKVCNRTESEPEDKVVETPKLLLRILLHDLLRYYIQHNISNEFVEDYRDRQRKQELKWSAPDE